MKRTLTALILINTCFILTGQSGNLGLHGKVTWMSSTKVSVEYDWSDDSQLLDWTTTDGSKLVRGNGTLTITGGEAHVSSVVWRQPLKCTRIYAQNAKAINADVAHLNFITNVTGWMGFNFNPPEMIGLIYTENGNYWLENEGQASLPAPAIKRGISYTVDINITETAITARSSSNNAVYSHNLANPPDADRQVAVGGWGGDTEWGKIIVEGEVNITWQSRSDMIDIQSGGSAFSPVIEVTGNPVIEWIFYDGTTSSSSEPVKNYGSPGIRHNLLKVTPWSALVGINAGYDAADGGWGGFDLIPSQTIQGFQNLNLAKTSLRYLCASYSPLTEIDLSELSSLEYVELLLCHNLAALHLGTHPALKRLCIGEGNLSSIDISGCTALGELRGSYNSFPSITWGSAGANLWHICIKHNTRLAENIPDPSVFPKLLELLIENTNQTGSLVCHSNIIQRIEANNNKYTSVDITGCVNLVTLELSGNQLTSLVLGTVNTLTTARLKNCALFESQVDYALSTLDATGLLNGTLDLSENAAPSATGIVHYNSLRSKGWTVLITDPGQKIMVTGITLSGEDGLTSINTDGGTLQVNALVSPVIATDRSVTWSVVYGSKLASVNNEGVVKATGNGTVKVRATANDGSGIYGEMTISITNQQTDNNEEDYNIGKIIVSSTELKILFENEFISWRACLYNLMGNMVSAVYVEGDELVFNISSFPPGLYLIVLTKGQAVRVAEFVKP
jgi:hypothetical protein